MDENFKNSKTAVELVDTVGSQEDLRSTIKQAHGELYTEALRRCPSDDAIDAAEEKKLVRKLDRQIIPLLGICYFFYVRSSTPSLLHFLERIKTVLLFTSLVMLMLLY